MTLGLLNKDSSNRWAIRLLFRNQVGNLGQLDDPRVRIASSIVQSSGYRTRSSLHSGFLPPALVKQVETGNPLLDCLDGSDGRNALDGPMGKSELQVRCKVDDRTRLQDPEIAESL